LAPDPKSSAREELQKVSGVAASSIASEAPKDDAFIVHGNGPQVRIYCVFGDDAISGEGVNENVFKESPTEGDWKMSIPCLPEDLEWCQKKLKSDSKKVTARATGEKLASEESQTATASSSKLSVNLTEFLKP
jgi:hypothetical protein